MSACSKASTLSGLTYPRTVHWLEKHVYHTNQIRPTVLGGRAYTCLSDSGKTNSSTKVWPRIASPSLCLQLISKPHETASISGCTPYMADTNSRLACRTHVLDVSISLVRVRKHVWLPPSGGRDEQTLTWRGGMRSWRVLLFGIYLYKRQTSPGL